MKEEQIKTERREERRMVQTSSTREIDQTRSLFAFPIIRFWALHYDLFHLAIDWSSSSTSGKRLNLCHPQKNFSFSRFHARIGPKSQGKGIHVWWNANWGTFSKKMQIYSPPTFIYPEKKSDAKTIFFRNHNDILLHWNLFYGNCAFDLVRFESELEFASHNNISTNFQRSLILLSIQLHNRTEKLPTLNVTAFFAIFNSLSNNRVTSTRRKQHLELWHSTSIFTQILGGERVATILRRLATVWWSESYWQFGLNTRNCLFSIEFPNKRLAPSKRFDKGKNKSKNWI